MAFKYRGGTRTVETITRNSQQSGGLYDSYLKQGIQMYKAKEGDCTVRILPGSWEDTEKWGAGWEISIWVHFGIGSDESSFLCLDKMLGKECPICEARHETSDEDEQSSLKPSLRALCWVIDRDNEKAGPMLWSMPNSLFREINLRSIEKKTNTPILIDHPEEGFDLMFTRTGTGLKTKYTGVEIERDSSPVHDDQKLQKRWLDYIEDNPLPEVLNYYEPAYLEKVLRGKVDRRTRDEDEDAPPTRVRRTREPEPEDEDEAPPPRSGRRSRETPEDAPEPEAPARSSRRSREPEEEEPPFDADPPKTVSRRRALLDEEDEADGDTLERSTTVAAARKSLETMRNRRGRG